MRLAVTCLLCVGCDKVFLDGTHEVTIDYDRDVIGIAGTTRETYAPILTARTASDEAISIERVDDDTSRMETYGKFYALHYTSIYNDNELWTDAENVRIRERLLGRPTRTPVPAGTVIDFPDAQPLPGVGGLTPYFVMLTSGLWSSSRGVTGKPFSFDLAESISLSGPLGLPDSPDDVVTLAEYGAAPGSDYYEVIGALPKRGAITGSTSIRGALQSTARSGCIALTAQRDHIMKRLASVAPATYSDQVANWVLSAVPDDGALNTSNHLVAFDQRLTDQTREVRFANPFGGVVRGSLSVGRLREYHRVAGDKGVLLRYGMDLFAQPVAGTSCEPVQLLGDEVSLITSISIDGAALVRDDTVVVAGKPVTVSWQATFEGADYYSIALVELDPAAGTSRVAYRYLTTQHTIVLPRGALLSGKLYYVGVAAVVGAPFAKDGDFATYTYPLLAADASSGVFTAE